MYCAQTSWFKKSISYLLLGYQIRNFYDLELLQLKAINLFQRARKKRHVPLVSYYQNKNMLKIDAAAVFSDNMFLRI